MKRRGGCLAARKRQPQLIGGETPLHQCRREYDAKWLRMEDQKAPLIKAVFSDLDRIKAKSLGSTIFKIGSSAKTKDLIFKWWREVRLSRRLGMNYPWWPRAKELIESPYELVYSHNSVPPWEVQTGSRHVMLQSHLSAEVYKNFVMNDLEDLSCLRLRALEKHWSP